jgi:hypothetical protein
MLDWPVLGCLLTRDSSKAPQQANGWCSARTSKKYQRTRKEHCPCHRADALFVHGAA